MSDARLLLGLVFLLVFFFFGFTQIGAFTQEYSCPEFKLLPPPEPESQQQYIPIVSEVSGALSYVGTWIVNFWSLMIHPCTGPLTQVSTLVMSPIILTLSYLAVRLIRGGG
jgi:hypothetical protein